MHPNKGRAAGQQTKGGSPPSVAATYGAPGGALPYWFLSLA